jgi:hypothetical protein
MSYFYLIVVWLLCRDSEFCRHCFSVVMSSPFWLTVEMDCCGRRATLLADDKQTKQPAAIFCRCNLMEEDNGDLFTIFVAVPPGVPP